MWVWAKQVWSEPGRPARPAIVATILLATLSAIAFVALVVIISVSMRVSVGTAIFGPGPGTGIFSASFAVPAIALQGLVAMAVRQRARLLRTVGVFGALVIAAVSVIWVVAVGIDATTWLVTGAVTDFGDLVGEIVFVPVAAAFAALNARSAWLAAGDLRIHRREPVAR
jgi:hypothetical protein